MKIQYPRAEGSLLEAVQKAQKLLGCAAEQLAAREEAERELISLCPHVAGSIVVAKGGSFEGRQMRVKSVEVRSAPHYASHTMFQHESIEWYWVIRGPLVLRNGIDSDVNEAIRFETFHVHIPPAEPISGDMCW